MKENNINRLSHRKCAKMKSKFSLILGKLHWALNKPAQVYWKEAIYIGDAPH